MGKRDYKKFAPESFYHVYNRGVAKMNIFDSDQDYAVFFNRIKENLFPELETEIDDSKTKISTRRHTKYKRKTLPSDSFSLVAYCFMPNHFHLLIKQNKEIPISKLINKVCTSYSKYFNLKYQRVGSLFQDQFKAVHVDTNEYLLWLSAYIHLNPVIAGLVKYAENWKWGSYTEYLYQAQDLISDKSIILGQYKNPELYQKVVSDSLVAIRDRKYSEVEIAYAEFEPLDGAHGGD